MTAIALDQLDRIAAEAFEGYIVRKDLVRKFARQYPVPTYVCEFLLGRYCASINEEEIQEGLQIVERQLRDRAVRSGEEELFKARARETGILVPEFVHVLNYDRLREFMTRVPGPWLLKPRSQASGIGMKKIQKPEELWPWLDQLGDQQSFYLLEQFVPGSVYHVDSVTSEREVVFAEAHSYGAPPLETSHHGGVFTTRTLPRDAEETLALHKINRDLVEGLGLLRGVTHAEFLKSHADGKFYFIEIAARVGGAYIADVIEAATGINLWREWARLEVGAGKQPYQLPAAHNDYAGVILSLARQEHPDTSAYNDPEIVYRVSKFHHAGFVLKSSSHERIQQLLDLYSRRFTEDFLATQPVPEKPTA